MRGSNPKVVQMLSKPQRRAPNVHKMSTKHANARFPGPMSCKNLTGERRHFQNDANTTEVHGFVSHRNKGFQFFFDALFFLIPTGCFFSALFSKYIALFFFWYFATWTRCIGNCDTTCCVPSCFCFGTNEKFKIVWCGNSMGLNFVRLE